MAKRETSEQMAVTFTKRRHGLFNKAADLCRICDAQIAITVSSTGCKEKFYTFGHPSVDAAFDRFLHNFPAGPEAGVSDAGIKSASNSIYEEIKTLEGDVNTLMQNKKRHVGGISWDSFEEFVRSSNLDQELKDVVESLECLLRQARNKLMNNLTGNLGVSNIVEPKSVDFLALELKPHDDSSPSLGDEIGRTTGCSSINNGIDFLGEVDMDPIWNLLRYSDSSSNSNSDHVRSSNSNDRTTSGTASKSASVSQENGDYVFPTTDLDSEFFFKDMTFVDWGTYNTTPDSDFRDIKKSTTPDSGFGGINRHCVMDGDCNAKQQDSAANYGFMDLVGEYGNCMTDQMGLPLLTTDAN
ncbi:unnamed protein product [Dovyalis caffra]|uniref:MADS-box domain-containing protein n=1 Tax=Dovyalis caffra TaxID=77055 RepID=A0AAV1SNJ4_9ROSI|nr:unnamed protein product [Dovyalis caffra]